MSKSAEIAEGRRSRPGLGGDIPAAQVLGVLGTSRKNGNTHLLANAVFQQIKNARLIDLGGLSIAPYSYEQNHDADDFLPIAQAMTKAEAIVIATPVYWYSMSAQMKTFFDRLTDLSRRHKTLGRALAGRTVFGISTGGGPAAPAGIESPLAETAGYFAMNWGGLLYASLEQDFHLDAQTLARAAAFADNITRTVSRPEIVGD